MPWVTSTRGQRLPPSWPTLRARILRRDNYSCQHADEHGRRCLRPANQVDHIVPGDDHREANLRALCTWHHGKKSAREGVEARAAVRPPLRRPAPRHPADVLAERRAMQSNA